MNSKEKLVMALTEELAKWSKGEYPKDSTPAHSLKLGNMIEAARSGYYSDYDSPIATPCIQLVKDLEYIGATELAGKAREGEFDATEEESNEWYEREGRALALQITGGNKEIADALFGKTEEEKEAKELGRTVHRSEPIFLTEFATWPETGEEKEAKEGIKGWDY
jgi:hypothetical protein